MKTSKAVLLIITTGLLLGVGSLSTHANDSIRLTDRSIPSEAPESVLPANALVHVRIRSIQETLQSLESFALNTVPTKALPAPIRPILQAENPLLTMLGMPLFQAPFTSDAIAERLGFDSESPVTLTLYPGDPSRFFILSLGMAEATQVVENLENWFGPDSLSQSSIGGRRMVSIRSSSIPIGSIHLTASENRIYLTGEPSLLIHLSEQASLPTLATDPHLGNVLELVKKKDIVVSINPGLVKPIVTQAPFFKYVPLSFLNQARSQLLNGMPREQRRVIEEQLRQQMGVNSLEEVLDYAECIISSSYEQLFDTLYTNIEGMRGATLAIRTHPSSPEFSVFLHHDKIATDASTAPIPLAAVKEALATITPTTQNFSVSGKRPASQPSPWISQWLDRTKELMINKDLDTKLIDTLQALHQETKRPNPVQAEHPWTLQVKTTVNPKPQFEEFDSILEYIAGQQKEAFAATSRCVTVLPTRGTDYLRSHFQEQLDAKTLNRELTESLFQGRPAARLIVSEQRLKEASLGSGVQEFTLESAYISQAGLFGYNQHEFINRKIYVAKQVGDYLVYHQSSGEPEWLSKRYASRAPSNRAALEHLIDRLPEGVNQFVAFRGLNKVGDLVHKLEQAEALAHRDLESFLERVRGVAASAQDRESLLAELNSLEYSPLAATINQDESGQFYCLLPGNLAFPRAKVTPLLSDLFSSFDRSSASLGGVVAYTRTLPGTKEWSVIWNTEGISHLIQSVGNTIAEKYLYNPEGIQSALALAISPRDRDPARLTQILGKNPAWRFLDQVRFPTSPVPAAPKEIARPSHPVHPRSEEATAQQIELGPWFNASPTETWHRGGIDGNDLEDLPTGLTTIGGITYDIRGLIQLTGTGAEQQLSVEFPKEAEGIKIAQTARQLHILHGCGWNDPDGTRIATYVVHYIDGKTAEIPIEYGIQLRDWWAEPNQAEVPGGDIAWVGSNRASAAQGRSIQLYHLQWDNPRPDTLIAHIDLRSERAHSAPFLLAITAE